MKKNIKHTIIKKHMNFAEKLMNGVDCRLY